MIEIKIPVADDKVTDEWLKDYEHLLRKIAGLPKQERIKVDAYATGLADAARAMEKKSA